jgi:predicted alpha/beta-fold hydrolase
MRLRGKSGPDPERGRTVNHFQAPWWLRFGHLQTLWPTLCRKPPQVQFNRERLELPDGDFIDLDWITPGDDDAPLVLMLHGLGGSSQSSYASGVAQALKDKNLACVIIHFRGCSGEPNRLDRSYHSGDTADISHVASLLTQRYPGRVMGAVGFSLGGNVLLKWLGECGAEAPVQAAVAVSVPYELNQAANALNRGFSRVYQWHLIRTLVLGIRRKFALRQPPTTINPDQGSLASFWAFDNEVTAPLHGFDDVHHYYADSSCGQFLDNITVPTLLIHAADDPFLPESAVPCAQSLPSCVSLELSRTGGHVGFVAGGKWPGNATYWLEDRIPGYLTLELTRQQ